MPGRRRAQIAFSDSAAKQLENLTDEHQIHALGPRLVAISVDPEIGEPIPGDTTHPELLQYADEIERVRVLYAAAGGTCRWRSRTGRGCGRRGNLLFPDREAA
ncbi:hypothetical protein ACFXMT_37840 [Streptomyces mirabilis]|uniref:hypothetical protein n=1 Tax=Streptomyces mirabilis TaxID=68239 RepID=UPI0036CB5AF8